VVDACKNCRVEWPNLIKRHYCAGIKKGARMDTFFNLDMYWIY